MTFRPLLGARAAALGALFVGTVVTSEASAQTLALRQGSPIRDDQDEPLIGGNHMNRADCINDDFFEFAFTLTSGVAGTNNKINAWAALNSSTDCSNPTNQAASQSVCRQVAAPVTWGDQIFVTVRVQDIVSPNWGPWTTPAGPDVCDGSADPVTRTLQFFLVDSGNNAGPLLTYDVAFDLFGPDPPTNVKAGVGEDALVVTWEEANDATDISGYQIFVDAEGTIVPGSGGTGGAGMGGAGTGGAGMAGSDLAGAGMGGAGMSGAGTSDAGMGGAGVGGAGTAGAATGGSGTAGSGTPGSCSSDVLVPGQPVPDGMSPAGESNGAALEAEARNLTNGVRYAVAVAGIDAYLNTGNLSTLACATPEPVTGFFEAYREAGGGGGGGYCAIGQMRSRLSAAGIVFAALGLTLRRLRRRKSSATNVRGPS
jgi:hypothetical protein